MVFSDTPIEEVDSASIIDRPEKHEHQMRTRGLDGIRKLNAKYLLQISASLSDPNGTIKTLENPDWVVAMELEYQTLINNETWDLVLKSPEQNVLSRKWIL